MKNFAYTQNCGFRAFETDCRSEDSCSELKSWIPQVLYIAIGHHAAKYTVSSIIRWAVYRILEHYATHTEIEERRFCREGSKEIVPVFPESKIRLLTRKQVRDRLSLPRGFQSTARYSHGKAHCSPSARSLCASWPSTLSQAGCCHGPWTVCTGCCGTQPAALAYTNPEHRALQLHLPRVAP